MKQKKLLGILTAFVAVFGVLALAVNYGVISIGSDTSDRAVVQQRMGTDTEYREDMERLSNIPQNFGEITQYFTTLAQEKSAAYAFEILKRAQLPPNIDLHLLGHTVGDELYKQEGLEGMLYCSQDFRNACSHSVVIGALLAEGMGVFDRVNDVCMQAPGGVGAYTMCFHGFGHGVLAFTDYEFPDAVKLCERVGTDQYNQNEFHQCVGGMVMEMHQGIHDVEVWESKKDKYLDPEDPLKLCQAEYMPDEAKDFCYTYITPYMFDAAGAVNGNPTPDVFEKAFSYCENIPEPENREICYSGFGKEFIVLAQNRDIRQMDQTPNENMQKAIDWCGLAHVPEGIEACLLEISNSLYWGGENDYGVSIRYCNLMPSTDMQNKCYTHFFSNANFYERDGQTREAICTDVPAAYTAQCRAELLTQRSTP